MVFLSHVGVRFDEIHSFLLTRGEQFAFSSRVFDMQMTARYIKEKISVYQKLRWSETYYLIGRVCYFEWKLRILGQISTKFASYFVEIEMPVSKIWRRWHCLKVITGSDCKLKIPKNWSSLVFSSIWLDDAASSVDLSCEIFCKESSQVQSKHLDVQFWLIVMDSSWVPSIGR